MNEETKKNLFNTLTDWYFNIKDFEKNGKIYEKVGIKTRKKIVLNTAGKIIPKGSSNYYLQSWKIKDIISTINWLKMNEWLHVMFWIQCIIFEIMKHNTTTAIIIALHFYLIILQRYNRWRLETLLKKAKSRKNHLS